jgi:hypothetical protein
VRVNRVALRRDASQLKNALLELRYRRVLAGRRSRQARNVLFEERATIIVRARQQRQLRKPALSAAAGATKTAMFEASGRRDGQEGRQYTPVVRTP